MIVRCLFHIHTHYSLDCLLSPRKVVARARRAGANILIVTDHETVRGSETVAQMAQGDPQFVVRAGEYKTEKGDIIGVLLKGEICSRNSNEVIGEIRAQGGLVVLPHPYKAHRLDDELLEQVDLIEVFNGRCSSTQNESSEALAHRLGKPKIAGSDAHSAAEIAVAVTEFEVGHQIVEAELPALLRTAPRNMRVNTVSRIYQPYSGLIKACRTSDLRLFGYQLKRMVSIASQEMFSS